MVNEQTLSKILSELEQATSLRVDFFAAFKMDDITDKWSIIVAVPDVTENLRQKVFTELVTITTKSLSESERGTIARIGTFDTNDHFIELLLDRYQGQQRIKEDEAINGNIIHEGFVIKSSKVSAEA